MLCGYGCGLEVGPDELQWGSKGGDCATSENASKERCEGGFSGKRGKDVVEKVVVGEDVGGRRRYTDDAIPESVCKSRILYGCSQ